MRRALLHLLATCLVVAAASSCVATPRPPPEDFGASHEEMAAQSMGLVPMQALAEPEAESDYCSEDSRHAPVPDLRIYATWQAFPLHRSEHGLDGTLRVLQDSRFTAPGSRIGTHSMLKPCDPLPGRIEVLDEGGQLVSATMEDPQIDVLPRSFGTDQTVYEVRTLIRCLASCWCGDYLSFKRVVDGKLVPLATRRASGEVVPVAGVVHGCYGSADFGRRSDGRSEVQIYRTVLIIPGALSVAEHHYWDGQTWRGEVVERKIPW
jgi:hypothetical protein